MMVMPHYPSLIQRFATFSSVFSTEAISQASTRLNALES